jgi:hypothetical protein
MKLCAACATRRCEQRAGDCDDDNVCQCPCALASDPHELAGYARGLRSVPLPFDESAPREAAR